MGGRKQRPRHQHAAVSAGVGPVWTGLERSGPVDGESEGVGEGWMMMEWCKNRRNLQKRCLFEVYVFIQRPPPPPPQPQPGGVPARAQCPEHGILCSILQESEQSSKPTLTASDHVRWGNEAGGLRSKAPWVKSSSLRCNFLKKKDFYQLLILILIRESFLQQPESCWKHREACLILIFHQSLLGPKQQNITNKNK